VVPVRRNKRLKNKTRGRTPYCESEVAVRVVVQQLLLWRREKPAKRLQKPLTHTAKFPISFSMWINIAKGVGEPLESRPCDIV